MENQTDTAYHGNPELKAKALEVAAKLMHRITSFPQLMEQSTYEGFAKVTGIPSYMARIAACIWSALPKEKGTEFLLAFFNTIPVGAQLNGKWRHFMVQLLISSEFGCNLYLNNEEYNLLAAKMAAYFSMESTSEGIPYEHLTELSKIAKESKSDTLSAIAYTILDENKIGAAISKAAKMPADAAKHQAEIAYTYATQNLKNTPERRAAGKEAAKLVEEKYYQAIGTKLLDILQHC